MKFEKNKEIAQTRLSAVKLCCTIRTQTTDIHQMPMPACRTQAKNHHEKKQTAIEVVNSLNCHPGIYCPYSDGHHSVHRSTRQGSVLGPLVFGRHGERVMGLGAHDVWWCVHHHRVSAGEDKVRSIAEEYDRKPVDLMEIILTP